MMAGIMSVSEKGPCSIMDQVLKDETVHGEPGDDKITYANDIIDWISARLDSKSSTSDVESKSKL